jgi:hypothetical protein
MNGVFPSDVYGLIIDQIILDRRKDRIGYIEPCGICISKPHKCVHLGSHDGKQIYRYAHVCKAWRRFIKSKRFIFLNYVTGSHRDISLIAD